MIDLTGYDLIRIAEVAYDLSAPQGMGFPHYQPGPMQPHDREWVAGRIEAEKERRSYQGRRIALSLDYLSGRAVKLTVWCDDAGKQWIDSDHWFDHSDRALQELLRLAAPTAEGKAA